MTEPRRGLWRTVRAKVVATTLAVTALGLTGAGLVTYAIQRQDLDDSIDAELTSAADQFRRTALANTDLPVDQVLRTAMQQTLPDPADGSIALVDGAPAWYAPTTVPVRLEDDAELVALLRTVPADDPVRLRTVTTTLADYRLVTVPLVVDDPAAPAGLFAVATVRDLEVASLDDTWRTYAAVAAGALLATGVVAWLLLGRVLRPVRELRDTAARIDEGTLDARVPVTTDDDVGEVGLTVNAMLDRLQASMSAQRRLLDDVGHELRTPLTIIGGHLELMDVDDPDDVRATRELALDEVDRMRLLVDDLLVLAVADREGFVQPAPTDLGVLTDEVLDKASGLGARTWRVDKRADVACLVDARRLTQAWLQLASNAVKFSAEGSTVTLGSAVAGGSLRLWVRDEGVGIPAEQQARIFERFERTAAAAGTEGAGLGLAIVAAIARAHGGRVDVSSEPGIGSTFVVTVPAVPVTDAGPDDERDERDETRGPDAPDEDAAARPTGGSDA
ncbi:sensor histidine kinase [Cellulomonas palmilytica]|uniref:sensor histidine kinase n=1 Tax=Cellulomonas palmilytica TaxID=2608402 RepID=UPI001F32FB77|nr:HAMP domain-containing sensor histidine kinase [Cellulomonas palmilytica]UJP40146.1 HAMP domain-containing histidine kinase [Cellulomonas palmilytica]